MPPNAYLETDAPLQQWAYGFGIGHDWLEKFCDEYTPKEFDEFLRGDLLAMSFFASRELAETYRKEINKPDMPLEALADLLVQELPNAMRSYAQIGRILCKAALNEPALERVASVRSVKIGRNAPCPCGSGRKYKQCCGSAPH